MTQPFMHRAFLATLPLAFSGFILSSCDDGITDSNDSGIATLAGSWEGTEFVLTSLEDSTRALDMTSLGAELLMGIQPDGTFAGTATFPGEFVGQDALPTIVVPLRGFLSMTEANIMRIEFVPELPLFTTGFAEVTASENQFTIVDSDSEFDFDGDGEDEPATYVALFERVH